MTIKIAQNLDGMWISPEELDSDVGDLKVDIELSPESEAEEELIDSGPEVDGNIHISSEEEDSDFDVKKEFSFTLPKVPGSDSDEEIEEPAELTVSEDDD